MTDHVLSQVPQTLLIRNAPNTLERQKHQILPCPYFTNEIYDFPSLFIVPSKTSKS